MSVKIKVSYETEEELKKILELLGPVIKSWAKATQKKGRFSRAYINARE